MTAEQARKLRDEGEKVDKAIERIESLIGEEASHKKGKFLQISLSELSEGGAKNVEKEFKGRGFKAEAFDRNSGDDYKSEEWLINITF